MDPRQFRAARYFPGLDALRAVSILGVLWHHATPRPLAGVAGRGHLGVQLFFAISGFLITTLLLAERRRTGELAVVRFWQRRALRIFPLYYGVLGLFVVFAVCLPEATPERAHFFRSLPFYFSHTANWFVDARVSHPLLFGFAWSLSTEQQFYLVWPALLKWLKKPLAQLSVLALLIAFDQLVEARVFGTLPRTPFHVVTSFSASIGLGALLAIGLDTRRGFALLSWLGKPAAQLALLGLVAFGVASPPRRFLWFEASLSLLVASAALGGERGALPRLGQGPLGALGRKSYGVYLLHVPVLGALRRLLPDLRDETWLLFSLGACLTWGLAELSHHFFESRFLTLRPRPSFNLSAN